MLVKPHKRQCKQLVQTGWKHGENMREIEGYEGGDSVAVRVKRTTSKSSWAFCSANARLTSLSSAFNWDWLREELPADEPGIGRKGVLDPCSEVAGSPLATWNPYPISVSLLIASVTWTPRDHLRFLNLHKHLFGTCSETTFFWMVCLSLMAQYPQPDQVTVWKPPFKRSWSCTKVSKVSVLVVEADPETGSMGVWIPCSEVVLLPWVIVRSYSTNVLLPILALIWKSTFWCKGISTHWNQWELFPPFAKTKAQ